MKYSESDKNRRSVVYKITNLVNDKIYIGQTTLRLIDRLYGYKNNDQVISRAIRKYGEENFLVEVLEECDTLVELNQREEHWISKLDATNPKIGYNLQSGGLNRKMHERTRQILKIKCRGWKHTSEAKRKITEKQTGDKHWTRRRKMSKEHRKNLSKSHMGFKVAEETKEKIRRAMKKRRITWGEKISEAKRGKFKVTIEQAIGFINDNPNATSIDFKIFFTCSDTPLRRTGGIIWLRAQAKC